MPGPAGAKRWHRSAAARAAGAHAAATGPTAASCGPAASPGKRARTLGRGRLYLHLLATKVMHRARRKHILCARILSECHKAARHIQEIVGWLAAGEGRRPRTGCCTCCAPGSCPAVNIAGLPCCWLRNRRVPCTWAPNSPSPASRPGPALPLPWRLTQNHASDHSCGPA